MELKRSDFLKLYRLMVLTRLFDLKTDTWHRQGLTREVIHPSTGQEAITIGSCYGLRTTDQVMPSLRSRGAFFAKGVDIKAMLLAQTAKKGSPSNGHETSHHSAFPELGVLAGTGMVGSSISIGVGAALAIQLQNRDDVVLNFFGDGATNRGDFHEAINLAAVWKLPCVFIVENNQVALSTMPNQYLLCKKLSDRAIGYGIPGYTIDGNNVLEVYKYTQEAIARARKGEGPTLLDCVTFRMQSHAGIFPDLRPKGLIDNWVEKCPLSNLEHFLIKKDLASREELKNINTEVDQEIEDVFQSIKDIPSVTIEDMLTDVYEGSAVHE